MWLPAAGGRSCARSVVIPFLPAAGRRVGGKSAPHPGSPSAFPVYNGEKYVAESLEALLGQSFTDFELIISDNASTDGTGDICRRYEKQDSRVRYFRQPRNIGLAPNVNFIIGQARGELYKRSVP